MSPTGTLRIDWVPGICFAAFFVAAAPALYTTRNAPSLVRLGYTTSERSHNLLFGIRQIGQGNVDLAPRIVTAQVLKMVVSATSQTINKTDTHTSS